MPNIPQDPKKKVEYYLKEFTNMHSEKTEMIDIVEDVDRYVIGRYVNYESNSVGENQREKFQYIYDQTAINAMRAATSALNGILWKRDGFSIVRSDNLPDQDNVNKWFERATDKYREVLDNPASRFSLVFNNSLFDDFGHGSTAIGVYKGEKSPLIFRNHFYRFIFFRENGDGVPDFVAVRTWMPVYKVVDKYGFENVGEQIQKMYEQQEQKNTEIEIVQVVHPNNEDDKDERPYVSIHIARDQKHIVRESFYRERQIVVSRFWQDDYGAYGRSPAIDNIVIVRRINAVTSDLFDGVSQSVLPPLAYSTDAFNSETLDLSASAANPFDPTGLNGQSPVIPLNTVGDLSTGVTLKEMLKEDITTAFFVDRLVDFNNQAVMTATEFTGREAIRAASLNSLLDRQITEKITPVLEAGFNLLFNDNFFGFIPDSEAEQVALLATKFPGSLAPLPERIPEEIVEAIEKGEPFYKIVYTTPAARLVQSQEIQNTENMIRMVQGVASIQPDIMDKVNWDKTIEDSFDNSGIADQLRTDDQVQEIRERRMQDQEQQRQDELAARGGVAGGQS